MRVVGVIAEYNPFHLGHAHHLAEARRLYQADAVVVVMSSVFTQRGDAALLSPADRAKMALNAGADAVFALPAALSSVLCLLLSSRAAKSPVRTEAMATKLIGWADSTS